MANVKQIKRAPVTITLDKERTLKYTLNAFAEMEERYGTVDAAIEAMESGSIKGIRFMLWAGLIDEDETLTEQQVGAMIELQDLPELAEKMNAVMTVDLPDPETATASKGKKNPNV